MHMQTRCETSQQLIAVARERGYSVSRTQIARWHRAGLLPRPVQRAQGRARGTVSLYPPGTSAQLLALCALRLQEHRLSQLAWKLWWNGFPGNLTIIRAALQAASNRLSRLVEWCVDLGARAQSGEKPGAWLDEIEAYAERRLDAKPLLRARKRVGKTNFPTLVRMLVEVVAGTFVIDDVAVDDEEALADLRILAGGLGLEPSFVRQRDELAHSLTTFVAPLLRQAGSWLRARPWESRPETASDFELMQARDELRQWLVLGAHTDEAPRWVRRAYPLWSRAFYERCRDLPPGDQALLLALWLPLWRG